MKRVSLIFTLMLLVAALAACGGRDRDEVVPATATPAAAVDAGDAAGDSAAANAAADEDATATPEPAAMESEAADAVAADASESPVSPIDAPESPLPLVEEPPSLPTETGEGTGAFTGRIMIKNGAGERPVANMIVALADVLYDGDTPLIAGYDATTRNKTATDELGRFAMNNVPEGNYAIILDAVMTSVLLADPEMGDPILLEITAGDVTDLGRVDYESLALPGYLE
ncbi:MAG: hypothetical protein KDD92_08590 [Caldilineaceae bacterium]|nr:hypothetical protein [Caldilineaceae bacterium]